MLSPVADEDYESFWNTLRPKRGQKVERPEPISPNPCAEIGLPEEDRIIRQWAVDHNALIRNLELPRRQDPGGEFVPDFVGPEGNAAPQSEFERQAILRSRVWLGEIRRHSPRTAAALWTRASDAITVQVSEYCRTFDTTMNGVDDIIRHEVAPLLSLIRRNENGTLPGVLEQLINPNPTIQAIRRNLGIELTTEELMARIMNEVANPPPSPVTRAIEQERSTQNLLDRIESEIAPNFVTTWMNPDEGPTQLNAIVRAFRDLGIPVDAYLQLQNEPGSSTLTLVINNQTIRIESSEGNTEVRLFDLLQPSLPRSTI